MNSSIPPFPSFKAAPNFSESIFATFYLGNQARILFDSLRIVLWRRRWNNFCYSFHCYRSLSSFSDNSYRDKRHVWRCSSPAQSPEGRRSNTRFNLPGFGIKVLNHYQVAFELFQCFPEFFHVLTERVDRVTACNIATYIGDITTSHPHESVPESAFQDRHCVWVWYLCKRYP